MSTIVYEATSQFQATIFRVRFFFNLAHQNYIWKVSTDTDEIDQSVALHRLEFLV